MKYAAPKQRSSKNLALAAKFEQAAAEEPPPPVRKPSKKWSPPTAPAAAKSAGVEEGVKKLSIDVDAKADVAKEEAVVSPGTLANNPFVRRDSTGSGDERPAQLGSPKRGSSAGLANNPFMRRDSKG